jgi:type VI secretion system protein ImpK
MREVIVNQIVQEPRVERRENLAFCFQELFTAIVRVRFNLQSVPSADDFRANAKELIRMATQEASARGYAGEDVKAAAFAIVAFLDESVLTSKNQVFSSWSRLTLQEELFGEHMAGETFFRYVQLLLSRRDSAETVDVLEVYDLCMLLGYRGRYGSSGAGELRAIMENIKGKTIRVRGNPPLSPAWALPGDPALPKQRDPWLRRLAWAAVLTAALGLVTFVASEWALASGNSVVQLSADQLR